MYLLDTNVISELRKGKAKANPQVIAWANSVPLQELYISAISILEIERGILLLERRDSVQGAILREWFEHQVLEVFKDRIINIDQGIAKECARIHVPNPASERDALIGASARVHGMVLVTRNVSDFKFKRLKIMNPWEFDHG